MNSHENFYRHCYQNTDGWVPMMPLGSKLDLGDFCQIQDSQFLPLGNIFNLKNFPDYAPERAPIEVSDEIELNRHDWQLSDGIEVKTSQKQRADFDSELAHDRSIWFDEQGSFSFNCRAPRARFILNWSQINPIIMLGLTLLEHSFREVYVVTRIASADRWELAIADTAGAELKVRLRSSEEDSGAYSHDASESVQHSRGLDIYQKSTDRAALFFQAKKLTMSDVQRDKYMRKILDQKGELPDHIIANLLKSNLFNQVKEYELNKPQFIDEINLKKFLPQYLKSNDDKQLARNIEPFLKLSIAPYYEYFEWTDISLDDVERLC